MGSTPTTYPLTSEDLRSLGSISDSGSFTSQDLRDAMSLSTKFTSDDLLNFNEFSITVMNGVVASAYASGVPSSGVYIKTDGSTQGDVGSGSSHINVQNWGSSVIAGVGSEWQVKVTKTGATLLGPDVNTWHTISSNLFWYMIDSTNNGEADYVLMTFQFRRVSDTSTVYSGGTIQLNANRGSSLIIV